MKTINKLKEICKPYGVTIDVASDGRYDDWHILFDAPPEMCWCSTTATVVCWNDDNIRGIVKFIRQELAEGFYPADDDALRITGQGKYAGA